CRETPPPLSSALLPYTTLFRSQLPGHPDGAGAARGTACLVLSLHFPTTVPAPCEVGVRARLPGVREPTVDVGRGGFGRQVVGGQEALPGTWWSGPVDHFPRRVVGQRELRAGYGSASVEVSVHAPPLLRSSRGLVSNPVTVSTSDAPTRFPPLRPVAGRPASGTGRPRGQSMR